MRTRDKMALAFLGSSFIDTLAKKKIRNKSLSKWITLGSDSACAIISTLAIIHHFRE